MRTAFRAFTIVVFYLAIALCSRADQTVIFGATWCGPCRSMEPIEDRLIKAGYRISRVDIDQNPKLAQAYHVRAVPCFVHVREFADGTCRETGRIVGVCTEGQLRRLAVIPAVTTVGAATRSAVRAILSPIAPCLEW